MRTHRTDAASVDVWFLHGYGDSGQAFAEAYASPLKDKFNLFTPDIPGFGVSRSRGDMLTLDDVVTMFSRLISKVSEGRSIALVGHSMGGMIGTRLARLFEKEITTFFNVEGNLTAADAFYTKLAFGFDTPEELHAELLKVLKIQETQKPSPALARYIASVEKANSELLWNLGRSCAEASELAIAGTEYLDLKCKKIYVGGAKSVSRETLEFINQKDLAYREFAHSGHWPMIDESHDFYTQILALL